MSEPRAEIQPELWVGDGPAAVAYYEQALGAVVEHRVVGPGERDVIAQLSVSGARFWVSNASENLRRFSPHAIGGATARMLLAPPLRATNGARLIPAPARRRRCGGDR